MSDNTVVEYGAYMRNSCMMIDTKLKNGRTVSAESISADSEGVINIPNLSSLENLQQLIIQGDNTVTVRLNADTIMDYMTKLTVIHLSEVHITGNIRQLAVPNLCTLILQNVSSEDNIQNLLDGLAANSTGLIELNISNYSSDGDDNRIPDSISNLTNLEELILQDACIGGTIPDLSALSKLRIIDLSLNFLQGEFPNHIINSMRNLIFVDVSYNNNLHGEINVRYKNKPLKIIADYTNTYVSEQYNEYLNSLPEDCKISVLLSPVK